ncbi:MAG: 5'/3'-nucleotidase SurE [Candidatus Sericytochromatia bacterium]|nr:5'/3'-nucleotidase SurE [Candidatus Sericytochromatia bacterium]
MRILVSNDDGITAPGIRALAAALAEDHEVLVVAPDRERSATGHALTLHRPLRAEPYEPWGRVAGAWAISGTPSDCVKLALGALLDGPPDLVCSGINRGPNLGTDVLYSGTVSAALEAVINDVPAVAFSLATFSDVGYDRAAAFAHHLVGQLAGRPLPPKFLLNVNLPPVQGDAYAGVRVTRLGVRRYLDTFEHRKDPLGRTFYWLAGEAQELGEAADSDVVAVRDNHVSITPIQYDLTHTGAMAGLQGWGFSVPAAEGAGAG